LFPSCLRRHRAAAEFKIPALFTNPLPENRQLRDPQPEVAAAATNNRSRLQANCRTDLARRVLQRMVFSR
jgi:hypothetical protein